jgi:iron complex outermembrane receptor protein
MFGVVNVITRGGAELAGTELSPSWQRPQGPREGRASWGRRLDNGVDVVLSASILRSRGEDRFYNYGATGLSGVAVGMDGGRSRQFYAHVSRAAWALDLVHGSRDKTDPTAAFFNDPLVPAFPATDRYDLAQLQYQDAFADDSLAVSLTVQNLFGKHQAQPASDTNWQNALEQDGRSLRVSAQYAF